MLWLLCRLPYSIVDCGLKILYAVEHLMLKEYKVTGLLELISFSLLSTRISFVYQSKNELKSFLQWPVLCGRSCAAALENFRKVFTLVLIVQERRLHILGYVIDFVQDGSVTLCLIQYMNGLKED